MEIALVEDRENYIHHEDGEEQKDGEALHGFAENESLALQAAANIRGQNFLRGFIDEIGGFADGVAGLHVEEKCDAGKLVDVIYGLGADGLMRRGDGVERNHALAIVAFDVQQAEIGGIGALAISHFNNYLILIVGLLDEVRIILRVGGVNQIQNASFADAVNFCLVAKDFHLKIWRVIEKIGIDE